MPDVYSDSYWSDEFDITTADLDRIAEHIRKTGAATDSSSGLLKRGSEVRMLVIRPKP